MPIFIIMWENSNEQNTEEKDDDGEIAENTDEENFNDNESTSKREDIAISNRIIKNLDIFCSFNI